MPRPLADYVALALVGEVRREEDLFPNRARDFSGNFNELKAYADKRAGFPISPEVPLAAVRSPAECALVKVTEDNFSGTFYKVRAEQFSSFLGRARDSMNGLRVQGYSDESLLERRSDYPEAWAILSHELFDDYHEHGGPWLTRALDGLRHRLESGGLDDVYAGNLGSEQDGIPASDRVVSLNHNEVGEFDRAASEVISAVSARNELDETPGLRELILGQLSAGRELIRSGCVRLCLLQVTLIDTLNFLAVRYEKEAIGALASALAAALLSRFGIDS